MSILFALALAAVTPAQSTDIACVAQLATGRALLGRTISTSLRYSF